MSNSETLWTAAQQASLSIANSQSLLKLMSIESEMPLAVLIREYFEAFSYMCKQDDCLSQTVLYLCKTFVSKILYFFSSAVEVFNVENLNIT